MNEDPIVQEVRKARDQHAGPKIKSTHGLDREVYQMENFWLPQKHDRFFTVQ